MSENLEVEVVYFYPLENAKYHKTDKYEVVHDEVLPIPVYRRGKKFTIAIRFTTRGYDEQKDLIKLNFNYRENPNVMKGTKGVVKLDHKVKNIEESSYWTGTILNKSAETITIEVYSPTTIPVGIWSLEIETNTVNSNSPPTTYKHDGILYLLFNPWNCHDNVYMPEERLLDEYILSDVGKIWVGPWGSSKGREWVFGQFDAAVLPAAMMIIERSGLSPASCGCAVKLTRMLSKMINSNDEDGGVLVGRWDGEYDDGTAPSAWTGSVPILQEYLDTEEPVNYGQCWVFSGVITTICRALGIPSRVVSNLVSAHDANTTLTVDKYYDKNNEEIDYDPNNKEGTDSIWNYHVWNDVWMIRPDLPPGYGGWQAIDATPQEKSSGFYQCGPASVEAIRRGQVGFNYDVAFMIASVNADLMRWKEDPSHVLGYTRIYCNKYHIGRLILTKKPFMYDPNGDRDREDVTNQYKPKEGTEAERMSLMRAVGNLQLAKSFYEISDTGLQDLEFDLVDLEKIMIGDSFKVVVNIKNNCDSERNVKAVLSAGSIFYNGVKASLIKRAEGSFKMKPKSTEQLTLNVEADEYLEKLVEYCNMKLYAIANVSETKQTWADEDDFQVMKPSIEIVIPQEIPVKKPTKITLKFKNPLKKGLTKCKVGLAGPTLLRNLVVDCDDLEPEGTFTVMFDVTPRFVGEQKLVATFTSKQLLDITGSVKVDVFDDEE